MLVYHHNLKGCYTEGRIHSIVSCCLYNSEPTIWKLQQKTATLDIALHLLLLYFIESVQTAVSFLLLGYNNATQWGFLLL